VGDAAEAILGREEAACRVNAGYAIDAERHRRWRGASCAHQGPRPRPWPDRAPDLTLKPADPEALNWVI
jgi:hypothetical protein